MPVAPDSLDYDTALALLAFQLDLGATEAICDRPVDRTAPKPPRQAPAQTLAQPAPVAADDPVAEARAAARAATTLPELEAALAAFDRCELKRGARSTVFADGDPRGRVMIVGEAPGRDEDRQGKPFVGQAGQLLDRMLSAIGLDRASPDAERAVYITNVLPWRPPENREPTPEEIAMLRPFLDRHIELADPSVLVLFGNTPCLALLGRRGITRMRGGWAEVAGRPALPMCHPAYLLRQPHEKRNAWADLLSLQARLRAAGP